MFGLITTPRESGKLRWNANDRPESPAPTSYHARSSRVDQTIEQLPGFPNRNTAGRQVPLGLLDARDEFSSRVGGSIVVFQAQVRDQVLAAHPAQRVLELH